MRGLFDVSHMGQIRLTGENPAAALETLVPGIQALPTAACATACSPTNRAASWTI